jgi:hypothetical protein
VWQISAKRKAYRERRRTIEQNILTRILGEDRIPNLQEVSERLGYRSDVTIRENHPKLCAAIVARHRQQRADYLAATAALIESLLERPSLVLQDVLDAIGRPKLYLKKTFPVLYRRIMAKCKESLARKRAEDVEKAEGAISAPSTSLQLAVSSPHSAKS